MNKAVYIISGIILVIILLVLFGAYFFIKPLLSEAKNNISVINDGLITTMSNYKGKGNYDILTYDEVSFIPIYNKKGELYAELIPEDYKSSKEYNIHSNELRSLLFIEDKGFLFRNLTFSVKGMARAIYHIHFKGVKQGGSGITQQLVKNVVIRDDTSSISRKYKELIVSYYIDNNYSKIDIINSYLNQISYGKNIYGIQKAGELYLGKEELRLEDTFVLNSMLKQPTYYYKNQDKLKQRAKYYLGEYLTENGISKERIQLSNDYIDSLSLEFRNHNNIYGNNEYIRDKAKAYAKENNLDRVDLNYNIFLKDEEDITNKIKSEEKRICELYDVCDIGVVVLSKSGEVNYLYGGDYKKSQVDSTSSKFELGSTLKPFIYAKFFSLKGNKSHVDNTKVCIGDYCPKNWDKSENYSVTFNKAINFSYNLPVIHIVKDYIKLKDLNDIFKSIGLYSEKDEELNFSMVLGTKPSTLFKLTNSYYSLFDGNFKNIGLFEKENKEIEIFNKKNIDYITNTLKNNGLDYNYSIKTGTSSNFKEHYLMALNDEYIIGIWMGNKDGSKTKENIYSITKGSGIFNILKEYF